MMEFYVTERLLGLSNTKDYYVTNGSYGVGLMNEKEANQVCDMINDLLKVL